MAALEMTDYLVFAALADMAPDTAAELLNRLERWAQGKSDEVQAVLRPALEERRGYLAEALRRQAGR